MCSSDLCYDTSKNTNAYQEGKEDVDKFLQRVLQEPLTTLTDKLKLQFIMEVYRTNNVFLDSLNYHINATRPNIEIDANYFEERFYQLINDPIIKLNQKIHQALKNANNEQYLTVELDKEGVKNTIRIKKWLEYDNRINISDAVAKKLDNIFLYTENIWPRKKQYYLNYKDVEKLTQNNQLIYRRTEIFN